MPIYAYRCESCGFEKDILRRLSDPPLTVCPQCGKETLVKQVTAAGFQLKGSGWYVTDFRDNGGKKAASGGESSGGGQAAAGESSASSSTASTEGSGPKSAAASSGDSGGASAPAAGGAAAAAKPASDSGTKSAS